MQTIKSYLGSLVPVEIEAYKCWDKKYPYVYKFTNFPAIISRNFIETDFNSMDWTAHWVFITLITKYVKWLKTQINFDFVPCQYLNRFYRMPYIKEDGENVPNLFRYSVLAIMCPNNYDIVPGFSKFNEFYSLFGHRNENEDINKNNKNNEDVDKDKNENKDKNEDVDEPNKDKNEDSTDYTSDHISDNISDHVPDYISDCIIPSNIDKTDVLNLFPYHLIDESMNLINEGVAICTHINRQTNDIILYRRDDHPGCIKLMPGAYMYQRFDYNDDGTLKSPEIGKFEKGELEWSSEEEKKEENELNEENEKKEENK